ncbi:MAG TPA: PadR family transcriptional regulator [Actinomycetota bacterium]|nr:PadR family transcriptional regulator [Actinomycetota bacterium]
MDNRTFHIGTSNPARLNPTAASLLGFLLEGPLTGWDIVSAVDSSIGYFWNLTRSQVYRELRTLADLGLVEVGEAGPRDRRPYTLTEAGREAFFAWLRQDPGDDLIRMQALLKFFFADYIDEATLKRFIALQRLQHEGRLAYFKEILPGVEELSPLCAYTLRFGINYTEMALEWLDGMPIETAGKDGRGQGKVTTDSTGGS